MDICPPGSKVGRNGGKVVNFTAKLRFFLTGRSCRNAAWTCRFFGERRALWGGGDGFALFWGFGVVRQKTHGGLAILGINEI